MPPVAWDSPVQFLKGVGPVRARALDRLGVATVGDLLRHYPRTYLDRTAVTPIRAARPGDEVTVQGQVLTAGERRTRRKRTLQTITVDDGTGVLFCQWFGQSYLLRQFRSGVRVLLSGRVQLHAGRKQLVHPDFELLDADGDRLHTGRLVPVYPLTSGIGQHWLRRLIHATLTAALPSASETLPQDLRRDRGLCSLGEALTGIHFPGGADELARARERMVYEEIFFIQLAMGLRRRGRDTQAGRRLDAPGDLTSRLVTGLPFALTDAQRRVLREILHDLRSGHVMHRLLQGDVGCGKTLVALIAALFVIEQGHQALLMAPTEVLARQHGQTIGGYCETLGLAVATLTGGTPARERRKILDTVHAGEIDLLVGTHALVQAGVSMPRLGLAIVDEQHRFGVQQRGRVSLVARDGTPPHMLVMSATPIPRSLSLTLYGDLDLSIIDELPAGRRPVATELVTADELAGKHEFIKDQLREGRQAFVIYPVIEETEGQDLKSAKAEFTRLARGPYAEFRTGLLHGKLRPAEKHEVMDAFATGDIDLLVATTVVEVGLDVPNATVMLVHHPERFGLAQLHQLRGRIGRGRHRSHCLLVNERWLPPETYERLTFFCAENDGFRLAEEDLRRRGPGDILGVRQHGAPVFLLANPLRDARVVAVCAEDVQRIIAGDPELAAPAHQVLRTAFAGPQARYAGLAVTG